MGFSELLSRTSIANVTAAAIMVAGVVYAVFTHDSELLKALILVAAGYLFGSAVPGGGSGGKQG